MFHRHGKKSTKSVRDTTRTLPVISPTKTATTNLKEANSSSIYMDSKAASPTHVNVTVEQETYENVAFRHG